MAPIDSLPADQRAVLELVLRRGRSYDEIARLLSIDRAGVRRRALAALDTLGPQTRVSADRRALITDYLLDALPAAVAAELEGLAARPLPEIPTNGVAALPEGVGRSRGGPRRRPSSRLGGAILLALAAAVVLAFVVFAGGRAHRARPVLTRAQSAKTTTGSTPTVLSVIALSAPGGGRSPAGAAEFVRISGRMGVAIAAQGLAPNAKKPPNYYAAWLYNSPSDAYFLGFAAAVGSNGELRTGGFVPPNASHYHHLLLTLERTPSHCTTSTCKPSAPGQIVLEGTLKNL